MGNSKKLDYLQLAIIAGMYLAAALSWDSAPDRIPVHWNASGQVDRYGGKVEGLLLLPSITLGLYLLLRFLPRVDPGRANYAQFSGAYGVIRLGTVVLMAGIYALTLLWINDVRVDMNRVLGIALGLLFVAIGSVLGKVRPNWFVGVRTPWTLSSKRSWVKTHRLGGWLFLLFGLLLLALGLAGIGWTVPVLLVGLAVETIALVIYSYLVWRDDPEKLPPSGTLPG